MVPCSYSTCLDSPIHCYFTALSASQQYQLPETPSLRAKVGLLILLPLGQHLLPRTQATGEHGSRSQQGKDTCVYECSTLHTLSQLIFANICNMVTPLPAVEAEGHGG